tara:strand:- start:25 stop:1707 length:1683 start_codon:yes stop_codon:yes gene_type:complete
MAIGLSSGTVANIRNFGREGFENFFPQQVRDSVYGKQASSDGLLSVEKPKGNRGLFDSLYDATLGRIPGLETSEQRDRNVYREKVAAVPEKGEASSYSARIRGLEALLPSANEEDTFKINQKLIELKTAERKEITEKLNLDQKLQTQKNAVDAKTNQQTFINKNISNAIKILKADAEIDENGKLQIGENITPDDAIMLSILTDTGQTPDKTLAAFKKLSEEAAQIEQGSEGSLSVINSLAANIQSDPEIAKIKERLESGELTKVDTSTLTAAIKRAEARKDKNAFVEGAKKELETKPNEYREKVVDDFNNGLLTLEEARKQFNNFQRNPVNIERKTHVLAGETEAVDTGYLDRVGKVYFNRTNSKWMPLPPDAEKYEKIEITNKERSTYVNVKTGEPVTTGFDKNNKLMQLDMKENKWVPFNTADNMSKEASKEITKLLTDNEKGLLGTVKTQRQKGKTFKPNPDLVEKVFNDAKLSKEFDEKFDDLGKEEQRDFAENLLYEAKRVASSKNQTLKSSLPEALKIMLGAKPTNSSPTTISVSDDVDNKLKQFRDEPIPSDP